MPFPTKLNEDISDRIIMLIRYGNHVSVAAEAVGIHRSTVYSWVERGEADIDAGRDTLHAQFAASFTKAQAEAQVLVVAMVRAAAARGDARAAMWMLERRWPESWGRKAVMEIRVERCRACGRLEEVRRAAAPAAPAAPALPIESDDGWATEVAEVLRQSAVEDELGPGGHP
jgi:transposase